MAYDPNKDQLLWESPTSQEGIIIQIRSYGGADPKIKFMRTFTRKGSQTPETNVAYGVTLEDMIYMGQFWDQMNQVISQARMQKNSNQGGGYGQPSAPQGGFGGQPHQQF